MKLHEHQNFVRSVELEDAIRAKAAHLKDPLSAYRTWLDNNDIPSEKDGWPSEEAFYSENVERFIESVNA